MRTDSNPSRSPGELEEDHFSLGFLFVTVSVCAILLAAAFPGSLVIPILLVWVVIVVLAALVTDLTAWLASAAATKVGYGGRGHSRKVGRQPVESVPREAGKSNSVSQGKLNEYAWDSASDEEVLRARAIILLREINRQRQ